MDIYLIDGSSYIYRAFYAIKDLKNSKGFPTNAIYGFTNMILKIMRERNPDAIAIVFDTPHPTRRHKIFEEYKAQRPEAPDNLTVQIPPIKKITRSLGLKIIEIPGYEADDILATLGRKFSEKGHNIYIVSGDKDILQTVDERIMMFDPVKGVLYDSKKVLERYGIPPHRIPELIALKGDAIDNIPGIRGIGEKTALKILSYGESLEEIAKNPAIIKDERLRKIVSGNLDRIMMNYDLARLDYNVPVGIDVSELIPEKARWNELLRLFMEFEFRSLLKLIPSEDFQLPETRWKVLREIETLDALTEGGFSFHILRDSDILGIGIASREEEAYYIPVGHKYSSENLERDKVFEKLKKIFGDPQRMKTGSNIKDDMVFLKRLGIEVKGTLYDISVASYLINPLRSDYSFEELCLEYLGIKEEGVEKENHMEINKAGEIASRISLLKMRLRKSIFDRLKEEGLYELYLNMEMPLIEVLADMEVTGIKIDVDALRDISKELERELETLRERIYFMAGEEFNINSPKQISEILFNKLRLKPKKKTKTGYSTEIQVLEELGLQHPLPYEILNYRKLFKLKTAYVESLLQFINPETGRLHTSFNQTATATGRLSSSEPNLQNIPQEGEWGERIRRVFVAEDGNLILTADYSQIELRIMTHMSGDPLFQEAFRKGMDIHTLTAMEIFGIPEDMVTPEHRRVAKSVNFGIIYGITPYGLSETLGVSKEEAQSYIERFFALHPDIMETSRRLIEEARMNGYSRTLFGRKRPVPELRSQNAETRMLGERIAVNAPVQGTASDIIKIAMINIHRRFREMGLRSKMILQIHDELVFEVPEDELRITADIVRNEMESAVNLSVPLTVNISYGRNWADLREI